MRFLVAMAFLCAGCLSPAPGGTDRTVAPRQECAEPGDCESGMLCLPDTQGQFCSKRCDSGDSCPTGWTCGAFGGVSGAVCLPPGACPDCTPGDGGVIRRDGGGLLPTIAIRVRREASPISGITVFFNDESGALLHTTETDRDGRAQVETDVPTTLTAVIFEMEEEGVALTHLLSFADVPPGELVLLDLPPEEAAVTPVPARELQVVLPSGAVEGADGYDVTIGCQGALAASPGSTITFSPDHRCLQPDGTVSIVAGPVDSVAEGRNFLGFSHVAGISLAPDIATRVDLEAFSAEMRSSRLRVDNTSGRSVQVTARDRLLAGPYYFGWITPEINGSLGAGGYVSREFRFPTGFGDAFEVWVDVRESNSDGLDIRRRLHQFRPEPGDVTVDVEADLMPRIDSVQVDTPDARPSLSWQVTPAPDAADAGRVQLEWAGGGQDYRWDVFFPADARRDMRYPEVPGVLMDELPAGGAYTGARVLYVACGVGGYEPFLRDSCPEVGLDGARPDGAGVTYSFAHRTLEGL